MVCATVCIDKPATVVVLKPVGDGLVPGVVTPQRAKVSQPLPQPPPPSFVAPTVAATQPSHTAIIQKLLQGGAFVVGRMPNNSQPYLIPSSSVGLQPFQVVFGSAGAKLPATAEPAAVPMQCQVGIKSEAASADGISAEAALAASNLLAEESREAAEKKLLAENVALTTHATEGHALVQSVTQADMALIEQVPFTI